METGNRRGVFEECRRRAAKDPQLWMLALRHLVSQPEGMDVAADVEEVLRELEGAQGGAGGGIAPLPVVQVLQSTSTVTLGSVRRYLTSWIGQEREAAGEDREALDELTEESEEAKVRTATMQARLARLERADYRDEDDLEYDEYEQEESKRLLSVRKDLDRKANDHEGFARDVSQQGASCYATTARALVPIAAWPALEYLHSLIQQSVLFATLLQLARAPNGFDVVAEYFGKGIIDVQGGAEEASHADDLS